MTDHQNDPKELYVRRLAGRRDALAEVESRYRLIGNIRLALGIAALVLAWFIFGSVRLPIGWLAAPLVPFIALVVAHSRIDARRTRLRKAVAFYERSLARVEDRWIGTGSSGDRFRDASHPYADDLDLFGRGSLFELICAVRTRAGEDVLAAWMRAPATATEVLQRQAAVAELRGEHELREDLAVTAEEIDEQTHPEKVAAWGSAPEVRFPSLFAPIAFGLGIFAALALGFFLAGMLGRSFLFAAVLLVMLVSYATRRQVQTVVAAMDTPARELELLREVIARLEKQTFRSPLLTRLQSEFGSGAARASAEIARLARLAVWMDSARNPFFAPFAALVLWRLQFSIAIERWRKRAGARIGPWIEAAGEIEALCSIAAYAFERPSHAAAVLLDGEPRFEAEALGHPLLAEARRVPNDLALGGEMRVLVVSGSNMSGKSTLLRAAGLNAVLAWMGAPVCARRLAVSRLQVAAAMRAADSLQDGKSRFYAEITRLRQVSELAAGPLPVLFLLDELLSGTNSHDRRIGAEAIVRSLVARGSIGLITTHDLALAHIADVLAPLGRNVHFEDHIEDGRIMFDYRLRPGVVERSNALELMRAVGLEV